jgi:hypothetical protein
LTQSSLLMLSWATCGDDGHWCNFLRLKLDSDSLSKGGVYVIWSEDADGSRKAAIYVGQGKPVAECLARHRDEATITQHERNGRVLRATWAKVRKEERGGQNATSQIPCDRLRVTVGPATAPFPSTFLGEGKTRQQTQPVCGLCWEGPGGCLASSQPPPRRQSVSLSFARRIAAARADTSLNCGDTLALLWVRAGLVPGGRSGRWPMHEAVSAGLCPGSRLYRGIS